MTRMDALSDVLRVVRLSGGVFLEADFSAPWCVSGRVSAADCAPYSLAPRHVMAFHFVTAGRMALRPGKGDASEVSAGEIVLLPHNDPHVFGSEITDKPVPAGRIVTPPGEGVLARVIHGGGGATTRMVCGFLGCDVPFHPLLAALPAVLKLDVRNSRSGAWLESSFQFAVNELAAGHPGSTVVIAKLSELLFVEAIGRFVASLAPERRGWLAGLRDPQIGKALTLLHSEPTRDWTAESLAAAVGLSRSAFAERFSALVEQPPMQYLTSWRLHLAADRLRDGVQGVAQVGYGIGYDSEAAFSRAFKRQFGVTPDAWRKGRG